MFRLRAVPPTVLFALGIGLGACAPGDPAVSVNDQVAAADQTVAAAEGAPEGGGEGGGGGPAVEFAAEDQIAWTVAPSMAPAGPVSISLSCTGLQHNVVFEGINGDQPIVQCDEAGTFEGGVELAPATYTYYCGIPGHRAGMQGEITVS